jgi:hypothetical protein
MSIFAPLKRSNTNPTKNDMKLILIIPLVMLTFISCEKMDNSKMPSIPKKDSIDVDNDSQYDFEIDYMSLATTDIPPSYQSITGVLRPLNNNQVLKRNQVGYLFLQINDTIKKENDTNLVWIDYAANLIGIRGDNDKWDKEWTNISDLHSDYFLGIKLKGDTEQIGWILLNLNTKSGEISIIDKQLTQSNELIINK